jgi:hypothetical protein
MMAAAFVLASLALVLGLWTRNLSEILISCTLLLMLLEHAGLPT